MSRRPVTTVRDLAAAKSIESKVDDLNETLGRLGITEEIQVASRLSADGTVRVALSHSLPEISALGVIARSLVEGRAGLWDDDGLTASGYSSRQMSIDERNEVFHVRAVARRLARRHEVWREASERYGSPGQWLQLKRGLRERRRFNLGYDNG